MNRLEALIIAAKLEVRLQQQEQLLNEVANLQKFIAESDYAKLAISFGRLSELIKDSGIDVSEYIQSLYEFISEAEENFQREQKFKKTEEEKLNMTLEELDFTPRTYNCLRIKGKDTVRDIVAMSDTELIGVRNLGRKSYEEVILKLKKLGLKLSSKETI